MENNIEVILQKYLDTLRDNTIHNIFPAERLTIYNSFGLSKFDTSKMSLEANSTEMYEEHFNQSSQGDFVLNWLAVLTVEKVLPIWDSYDIQYNLGILITPQQIVEMIKKLLRKEMSFKEGYNQLIGDVNMGSIITNSLPYHIGCIYHSANSAMGTVLFGLPEADMFNDLEMTLIYGDFASEAVKAYSCKDEMEPGEWWKRFLINRNKYQPSENYQMLFDTQKRLEFWEWWLTQAIPQAWELAHSSSPKTE